VLFDGLQFPPYATNETGRPGMLGRRELGHGMYVTCFISPTCGLSQECCRVCAPRCFISPTCGLSQECCRVCPPCFVATKPG